MQPDSFTEPGDSGLGLTRPRRRRMSDAETARRMLRTAADAVGRAGLTVSLEHIRLEDVIREAGVARSAVYRRWPHKEQFLADLLIELAEAGVPLATTGTAEASAVVRRVVREHLDWLGEPGGSARLTAEVVRETALLDFRHILASPHWRTYLALTTTVVGLPPGPLRERVGAALARSERTFTARIAASHQTVARLLGMRLAVPGVTFDTLAHLANAMLRGMIAKALADPALLDAAMCVAPVGAAADWSLPGLGLVALASTYLEPDPQIVWDHARIDRLANVLSSDQDLFADQQ